MSRYTEVFQRSLADYDSPVTGTCVTIGYDQLLEQVARLAGRGDGGR